MNTPVKFQLAKLLKEKGFDVKAKWLEHNLLDVNHNTVESFSSSLLCLPTIAEVVMWLYEKHGVWVSVVMMYPKKWEHSIQRIESGDELAKIHLQLDSPTEAYEAAIEYTLKNLISNK